MLAIQNSDVFLQNRNFYRFSSISIKVFGYNRRVKRGILRESTFCVGINAKGRERCMDKLKMEDTSIKKKEKSAKRKEKTEFYKKMEIPSSIIPQWQIWTFTDEVEKVLIKVPSDGRLRHYDKNKASKTIKTEINPF